MGQQIQDDDIPGHNEEREGVTEFQLAVSDIDPNRPNVYSDKTSATDAVGER
jgi:hypothetical protein